MIHTVSPPYFSPIATIPQFAGGKKKSKKKQKSAVTQASHDRLAVAGITPEEMAKRWNVTLWSAKLMGKGDKIRLRVDTAANPDVSIKQLKKWLADRLKPLEVILDNRPVKKCCHSPCGGCFEGDKKLRKTWVG